MKRGEGNAALIFGIRYAPFAELFLFAYLVDAPRKFYFQTNGLEIVTLPNSCPS